MGRPRRHPPKPASDNDVVGLLAALAGAKRIGQGTIVSMEIEEPAVRRQETGPERQATAEGRLGFARTLEPG